MTLNFNTTVEAECGPYEINAAGKILQDVKTLHGDKAPELFDALLVVLFFRALERKNPGSLETLIANLSTIAR